MGQLCSLKARLPRKWSIFDIYFDVEVNDWLHWDSLRSCCMPDQTMLHKLRDAQNKTAMFNNFWLTTDTLRYTYLIDRFLCTKKNVMFMGPSGIGKTRLIHKYSQKHCFLEKSNFNMTGNTEIESLKSFMLKDLKLKNNSWKSDSPYSKIIFIDDINMCSKDKFGVKVPHEFLR
jgi:chromosomal replication initiation ATPase DnaA